MKKNIVLFILMALIFLALLYISILNGSEYRETGFFEDWQLAPFVKVASDSSCLSASSSSVFTCPVRKENVFWEGGNIYNPSSVVKDNKIYLLFRAEDNIGRYSGTSRIGLAWSDDGYHFTKHPEPVLYPDNDFMKDYEWEGGIEDPRICEDESGTYYLIYTTFNGKDARLAVAVSKDLFHWEKKGLAFKGTAYEDAWSKAGSVVCRLHNSRFIATKINGKYWMYWGEQKDVYAAVSDDLIHWQPVEKRHVLTKQLKYDGESYSGETVWTEPVLRSVFTPRSNRFDSEYVEPGPSALITSHGILLIYNSSNSLKTGDKTFPKNNVSAGQILFDAKDPLCVIGRASSPFVYPELDYEISRESHGLTFINGLSWFRNQWFLYYDTADLRISIAQKKNN